jgi:hypothetical protein
MSKERYGDASQFVPEQSSEEAYLPKPYLSQTLPNTEVHTTLTVLEDSKLPLDPLESKIASTWKTTTEAEQGRCLHLIWRR